MSKVLRCIVLWSLPGLFLWTGCLKQENYSNIPAITLQSFVLVYDTGHYPVSAILTITFQDGDGNIGLSDGDTLPPYDKNGQYYYNFVIQYYERQMGQFVLRDLEPPLSARIPVLSPLYPGKPIKGVIADTLVMDPTPVHDTIRIDAFIYDRALNKSNVISTPVAILRRP
ncbi:MAG TPA: hypothetical protein VMC08_02955 [Bacteroidales bacterium]|nr:hypothetical protein [Bacteroidales bacterium]